MTIDTDAERANLDTLAGNGGIDAYGGIIAKPLPANILTSYRAALDEIYRLRGENDKLRADMAGGSFYQEKDIDEMQAEIVQLRRLTTEAVQIFEIRSVTAGICRCGVKMERHSSQMNCAHTPADIGEYEARRWINAARAVLSKGDDAALNGKETP